MLGQFQQVIEVVRNQSPDVAKQHIENQKAQMPSYVASDSRIDIPLREPLDPEQRLNRKLAKQIYDKERTERVLKHKEDQALTQQQIHDHKAKKEKK